MEVFVITNRTLRHNTEYFDVVHVASSVEEAREKLKFFSIDFQHAIWHVIDADFRTETLEIEEELDKITITDNVTGMFSQWVITKAPVDTDMCIYHEVQNLY